MAAGRLGGRGRGSAVIPGSLVLVCRDTAALRLPVCVLRACRTRPGVTLSSFALSFMSPTRLLWGQLGALRQGLFRFVQYRRSVPYGFIQLF